VFNCTGQHFKIGNDSKPKILGSETDYHVCFFFCDTLVGDDAIDSSGAVRHETEKAGLGQYHSCLGIMHLDRTTTMVHT
jgi:hypothetical protein